MADDVFLSIAGLLTGMMRVGFGGGVGVVAAPVLALVIPAKQALGVILPLTLSADAISLRYYWGHWEPRLVKALLPGCVVGIGAGSIILDLMPEEFFRRLLGGMACLFAILHILGSGIKDRLGTSSATGGLVVGVLTGFVSTLLHAGGVVMMLYLAPMGLAGRKFVATAFLIGVALNLVKLGPYIGLGLIDPESLSISLNMLLALAVGAMLGMLLNHKLPIVWFNRLILVIVLTVGIKLLLA
ncbi:MAG: sulfite exporter TauE/SafE family protein [Candidatus Latescibacterota bacterium]|nr:sulfite exporter TauE/SafE family protein [Candidatus Latescibacterota bacterium]